MMARQDQVLPTVLPDERLEKLFTDFKPAYDEFEAVEEANRCINCYEAPCIRSCPTAINIPQFIRRIASGNVRGAARTILESNILGLSCAQACPVEVLCVGACVYNNLNKKPIAIGKLQRYAVEQAYDRDWQYFQPGRATGKKVALIGSGPASLACAHELRLKGHETVVFEREAVPGGLNTSGIAPYKMKAEVSMREVDRIARMGVRFEYSQELGRNLSLEKLLGEYDAVFLGMGLGEDSQLEMPGGTSPGVHGAVDFISRIKLARAGSLSEIKNSRCVLVVGGGNTALDACRELKGLGIPQVIVSYRRDEGSMSGYSHEYKAALQEGVEFWFHTVPTQIEKVDGRLRIKLQTTSQTSDGKLKNLDGFRTLEADLVLAATGQAKLERLFSEIKGLTFDKGKLKANTDTGQTSHPKIFAAGDLVNGGKEVVNAVAEGKRAAGGIHTLLSKGA